MSSLEVEEFLKYPGMYVWQIQTTKTVNIWDFGFIYYVKQKKIALSLAGAEYNFNIKEFEELIDVMDRILKWVKKRVKGNVSKGEKV